MAIAIGNMGIDHRNQGRYAEALECHGRQLAMSEELGERRGMANAIGNMGVVYWYQGRYTEALECYGRQLAMSEELGNRSGMVYAIGNMGNAYEEQGRYAEALQCYDRWLAMSEELGDRRGMANAIGNMGTVHAEQSRYAEALKCYHRALDEHRILDVRAGVVEGLEGIARVLLDSAITGGAEPPYLDEVLKKQPGEQWTTAAFRTARIYAEECRAISQDLSKADTIFRSRVLLARIDAAEGNSGAACEQLEGMLAEPGDDDQRAELHYWLWKLSPYSNAHCVEAIALYESLITKTPKHEYGKRIADLTSSSKHGDA